MPVYVKNGTAIGSQSKCETCANSHILQGFRESEMVTYCHYATLMVVPFKVRECSNYADKARPTWDQMTDLAIEIRPTPTLKAAGFFNNEEPEAEEVVVAERK